MPTHAPTYDDDLRFAHALADSVERLTMDAFKAQDLTITQKPDHTPVTDADVACEQQIRSLLSRGRPRDSVLGEEGGLEGGGPRRWIIDPIDGTKNFMRGVPVWATLIALLDADHDPEVPMVGLVAAPALGRRWWAARGFGAWTGRNTASAKRVAVSGVSSLSDASISYSSLSGWRARDKQDAMLGLLDDVWRSRAYGDFWSHMLVAEGAVDIAAEPELAVHDMAALAPIVLEAGGRFTSLDGRTTINGGNAVTTNGHLHDEVLSRLGSPAQDG